MARRRKSRKRRKRTLNFKSKEAYIRWLRYGHATKVFERTPGHQRIKIRGKPHKVKHKK